MAKNTVKKSPLKSIDAHYWQISIALSALNVLIMLYQMNKK